ncbi:GGDEF domain-containing protein [Pseudomaricurvus sp.]|uniref:GGDEF domain-containing protein n=1 Tax=Pseudomaricurvus sp. TaxID=2004510 RepID=UPI003F6D538E
MPQTPGNKNIRSDSHSDLTQEKWCQDNHCPACKQPVPAINELCACIESLKADIRKLDEQVIADALTGLFNFRYIHQALDQEFERTQRTGQETTLILLDLDYFKQVNDRWGHDIGNQVLRHTADLINSATRKLDIPCRYGGEEFLIILPSTDLETGIQVAERLRVLIESTPLLTEENTIPLTASAGVDSYTLASPCSQETLIKRADAWLYQAKNNGRNQVCSDNQRLKSATTVSSEEKDALFSSFGKSEE